MSRVRFGLFPVATEGAPMRFLLGWCVLASCLFAAEPPADEVKKEMAKFRGVWKFTSLIQEGENNAELAEKLTLIVEGNKRTVKQGDDVLSEATYTLDPTQKPKHIDIVVSAGPWAAKTLRGIYELDGDALNLGLPIDPDKRPTELSSKADSGVVMHVCKRTAKEPEKPKDEPKKEEPKPPTPEVLERA